VRKWNTLCLTLALLLVPAAAGAQELPELFSAVYTSAMDGLKSGMEKAAAGMEQELTLELSLQSARIEEGKPVTLSVVAGNPRPVDTPVTIELKLPQRLAVKPDMRWQAVLPAARVDGETGELIPSASTFTREIALVPGGDSERAEIQCEMSMGTRFYRSSAQMELCVSDVTAAAALQGAEDGRLYPGDRFTYEIEMTNAGTAPKDVELALALAQGVTLDGELPAGFALENGVISGRVRAEAAASDGQSLKPSSCVISVPAVVDEDALEGDADAVRLMTGMLRVDGERVPLPRLQVCGARISARLIADAHTLKEGEQTQLRLVVVNSGLAPADVKLSCMLPEGLSLAKEGEKKETKEKEEMKEKEDEDTDEAVKGAAELPGGPADGAAPQAVTASAPAADSAPADERMLMYDVHMPAGEQTAEGVEAAAHIIRLNVKADSAQENLGERLVGASLAWSVDEGETQLGEAVAMRLSKPAFMGISKSDWNALFWASVLLVMTIGCLYAAAKSDRKEEDFCCE